MKGLVMTKEGVKKILNTTEDSLGTLRSISKTSKENFLKSRELQDRAKWNFYVAVQGCLDLGNHVISVKGFELPESYEDIITILEKKKIIPKELASSLRGMGGFRNLIAHGYFKIDSNKLWDYLKSLDSVKKFIKKLEPYLEEYGRH